jgi:hypothetical protein
MCIQPDNNVHWLMDTSNVMPMNTATIYSKNVNEKKEYVNNKLHIYLF